MSDVSVRIAVDGTAASGKGTLSMMLSRYFSVPFLDTGKMYRLLGKMLVDAGVDLQDKEEIVKFASLINMRFVMSSEKPADEFSAMVASRISSIPELRNVLFNMQRDFAACGAVLDGRDIGSVVLKDADFKFYVTAELSVRVLRRFRDLRSMGFSISLDEVASALQTRDEDDSNRLVAPLMISKGAVVIDTTDMDPGEVFYAAIKSMGDKLSVFKKFRAVQVQL